MTDRTTIALTATYPSALIREVVRVRAAQTVLHRNEDGSWSTGEVGRTPAPDAPSSIATPEDLLTALSRLCAHARDVSGGCLVITEYAFGDDPTLVPQGQWPTFTAMRD